MYITIKINNEEKSTESSTIAELAHEMQLPERGVAMAVNNRVVPRAVWSETTLSEGDNVTVIKAAFGG